MKEGDCGKRDGCVGWDMPFIAFYFSFVVFLMRVFDFFFLIFRVFYAFNILLAM